MNADSYYQPEEPIAEREVQAFCNDCETDQWHLDVRWAYTIATRECLKCGALTDLENDE